MAIALNVISYFEYVPQVIKSFQVEENCSFYYKVASLLLFSFSLFITASCELFEMANKTKQTQNTQLSFIHLKTCYALMIAPFKST